MRSIGVAIAAAAFVAGCAGDPNTGAGPRENTGTLVGAPKVRAMQLIDELEPVGRGLYGGTVGYFGHGGDMDQAITIRTLDFSGGKAVIQAGAGIVADSIPEREEEETRSKAQAMLRALELAESGFA